MSRERIRREAFEEAAQLAELYADTNMEICGDNILLDPLLRGGDWTEANMTRSGECTALSTIHSAAYHAGTHIAEQIRKLT